MKILFKNLFSFGLIQGINLLIPLLITPFLLKTIGVSNYGVVATAQSLAIFFILFTDFGFNLTSVRRIAQARGNKNEIESIVNGTFFLKLILLCAAFIIYILLILVVPQFNQHFLIYLCSFSLVIGNTFLPFWFYQGIEKMSKTILPVLIFKVLIIVLIFFLIKRPVDAMLANIFLGAANLLAGVFLLIQIRKEYNISLKLLSIAVLKHEFKNGFALFISNFGVAIYVGSSLLILSFFLTPENLGIYSIVDRILQILRALLAMVHNTSYPQVCNIVQESQSSLVDFIKKVYTPVWLVVLLLCLFLFFYPDIVVTYFIKKPQDVLFAAGVLKYFSFVLFIVGLNIPFYQTLLAYKRDWLTVRILFAGALLSVTLNMILVPVLNIKGAAVSMYIVEIMITATFIYYFFSLRKVYEQGKLFK
ncbi:MAG: oligosaccharide flippase family protein [Bacteroidota bacterium]